MLDVKPDISIIVPVYNTESFLPACLESIDAQGRGAYEVILVALRRPSRRAANKPLLSLWIAKAFLFPLQ